MTCIIVTGCAKSGTSMTAGVLRILGVPMGEDMGKWNNHSEDIDFIDLLREKRYGAFEKIAAERADRWGLWGMKHPGLRRHLDYLGTWPDTKFVFLFRDVIANVASQRKSGMWTQDNEDKKRIIHLIEEQDKMARWSMNHDNVLMVSYEKALFKPEKFIWRLVDFCGIDCNAGQLAQALKFIKPEIGYQDIQPFLRRLA